VYNPLCQTEVNNSAIKLVYPFIMNEKIDPLAGGASDHIIHLCKWMRSLVMQLADEEIIASSSKTLTCASRIFRELEADCKRGVPRADSLTKKMCHEANKANEYARHNEQARQNESIQTEKKVSRQTNFGSDNFGRRMRI
jgi:hypothetical protein